MFIGLWKAFPVTQLSVAFLFLVFCLFLGLGVLCREMF